MVEDVSILEWIFRGTVLGLIALGAKLWSNLVDDVKSLEERQSSADKEVSAFKLHVSEHYPKEVTMARLYKTIEDMAKDVNELKIMFAKKH